MPQNQIRSYNTVQLNRQLTRSKVMNRLMIVGAVIAVFIGFAWGGKYIGLEDFSNQCSGIFSWKSKATPVETSNTGTAGSVPANDGQSGQGLDPGTANSGGSADLGSGSGGGTPAAPVAPPAPTGGGGSACGNTAMPAAACTSVLEIERLGPKNNPYVAMDQGQLSQIPDGSTIAVNKGSWAQTDASRATVGFSITIQGKTYSGSLAMQESGGVWRAVNFSINQ